MLSPVADDDVAASLVERATASATAIHTVRDLVNMPPSDLYPETFAAAAGELAAGLPVEVEVLAEPELEAGGFGGILGVGRGSARGPRLVVVRYAPKGADDATSRSSARGSPSTRAASRSSRRPRWSA